MFSRRYRACILYAVHWPAASFTSFPAETMLKVYRLRLLSYYLVVTVSRTVAGKIRNDEKYFSRK